MRRDSGNETVIQTEEQLPLDVRNMIRKEKLVRMCRQWKEERQSGVSPVSDADGSQ